MEHSNRSKCWQELRRCMQALEDYCNTDDKIRLVWYEAPREDDSPNHEITAIVNAEPLVEIRFYFDEDERRSADISRYGKPCGTIFWIFAIEMLKWRAVDSVLHDGTSTGQELLDWLVKYQEYTIEPTW